MLQSKYTLSLDWLKIDMVKTVAAVAATISLTLFTDCNGNTIGLYIQRYCTVTELVHCDVIAYKNNFNKLILQYLKTRHYKYYNLFIVQYYIVKQKHTYLN